ncbi:uncharacterized protein L201_000343 [Kwoniella dendrophila CBS 6074]|uniref:Uncharacterized protein n=1 Tax=Kwoniella dendrophila CBS 6074 TaxID=1295534 RepID=A0AAX4JL51_9TREE
MFSKVLLCLLPLLPLFNAAPVPVPLLGLDNLPVLDSIIEPLVHQDNLLPTSTTDNLPLINNIPSGQDNNNGGLIDTLLDTVESITGPLNITLGANLNLSGLNTTLGLNIDLTDDNEELICGPVIGYWSSKQYNIPCVCWSQSKGIVIDAKLQLDLGLDDLNNQGLDTFVQAQLQFGGKKFEYPAWSMPTCDGDGGFTCPGGYSSNGKCTKFLAARPFPRVSTESTPSPTPAAGQAAAAVHTATDLVINSVPPTTIDTLPTSTEASVNDVPTSSVSPSPIVTVASPDQTPQSQVEDLEQPIQANNVALTTSTSTSTIILPATVFVEMITTTQPMTVWATQTQTQTITSTATETQTQWATQTQTQWSTTTMSNCNANADDGDINVNSVSQPAQNAGYTPLPPSPTTSTWSMTSSTSSYTSSSFSVTPTPIATSSSSDVIDNLAVPTSTPSPTPTPTTEGDSGNNNSDSSNDDADAFVPPPRVIQLAQPQSHPSSGQLKCSPGEEFKQTMCCRADQVEVNGECKCAQGLENVLNLNLCLSICLGDRLPTGECNSLGLGLDLNLGLGDLSL